MLKQPLFLSPEYRTYVWGGARLRPQTVPTAEAWVIYEGNRVASGGFEGRTLAELAQEYGEALLGRRAIEQTGKRFPLLVKLLDAAQWLSLQVHPNDEQALRLEGPGFFGKTEAWHVLEAEPGSRLISGVQAHISPEALADFIRNGNILDAAEMREAHPGDTLFMRPGTIHALGPGLLIYEIQQTSDLTYRVYDWGRPQTETRQLHIDKALAVSRPASAEIIPLAELTDGAAQVLTSCRYFTLALIHLREKALKLNPMGETFHTLTVIEGQVNLVVGQKDYLLQRFETALLPAACETYQLEPAGPCRVLKGSI